MTCTCLSACDKSEAPCNFIKMHKHPPVHLFTDLFARLSQAAIRDMAAAEAAAQSELSKLSEKDKDGHKKVGDGLLQKYMEILERQGSFVSTSPCVLGQMWQTIWDLNVIGV